MAFRPVRNTLNLQLPNSAMLNNNWDPTSTDGNEKDVSNDTLKLIYRDISECVRHAEVNHNHIFVAPDSESLLIVHTIIVGPENTPYEGGFFYFIVRLTDDYPMSPPKVKLMNTDENSVRFNPQFSKNGMISLSILSTNNESSWNSTNTLLKVLLSIRSAMNANPYYDLQTTQVQVHPEITARTYNNYIRYETLRVAVLNIMNEDNPDTSLMPSKLRDSIINVFKLKFPAYFRTISENNNLNNKPLIDPLNSSVGGRYDYALLMMSMFELAKKHLTAPDIKKISTLYNIEEDENEDDNNNSVDSECSELSDFE